MRADGVQETFAEFDVELRKIYAYYADLSAKHLSENEKGLLRPSDFISLVKDAKLVSGALTNANLRSVFVCLYR